MLSQVEVFLKNLEKKEKVITYLKNIYKVEVGQEVIIPEAYIEGKLDNITYEEYVNQKEKEENFSSLEEKIKSLNLPTMNDKNIKLKIQKLKKAKDTKFLIKHLNLSDYSDRGMKIELLKQIIEGMKILTSVENINLRGNNLDDSYTDLICELFNIDSLKRIDLSRNNFSKISGRKLINAIKNTNRLEYLDVSYNPFNFDEMTCQNLIMALKPNTNLYHFGICDPTKDSAFRIFNYKPDIRSLNLEDSRYVSKSFETLIKYLTDNKKYSLAVLSLKFNKIDCISASYLEKSLRNNKTLVYLNLYSTFLSDFGGSRIISALDNNRTLIEIDLGMNQLSVNFCKSFNKTLKLNNSLQKVNLSKNYLIHNDDFAVVLEGLVTNQSIISLGDLSEMKIGVKIRESAEIILDLNEKFLCNLGNNLGSNLPNNLGSNTTNLLSNSLLNSVESNSNQKMNFLKSSIDYEGQEKIKRENLDQEYNINVDDEAIEKVIQKYNINLSQDDNYGFFIY